MKGLRPEVYGVHRDPDGKAWLVTDHYNRRAIPLTSLTDWEEVRSTAPLKGVCPVRLMRHPGTPGWWRPSQDEQQLLAQLKIFLPTPVRKAQRSAWLIDTEGFPPHADRVLHRLSLVQMGFPLWSLRSEREVTSLMGASNMSPSYVEGIRQGDQEGIHRLVDNWWQHGRHNLILLVNKKQCRNIIFPRQLTWHHQTLAEITETIHRLVPEGEEVLEQRMWGLVRNQCEQIFNLHQYGDADELHRLVLLEELPWLHGE